MGKGNECPNCGAVPYPDTCACRPTDNRDARQRIGDDLHEEHIRHRKRQTDKLNEVSDTGHDHPPYYNEHPSGVECIDIIEHWSFNVGNAVKYLWRAGLKTEDPVSDLQKAEWYVGREIQRIKALEGKCDESADQQDRIAELESELYDVKLDRDELKSCFDESKGHRATIAALVEENELEGRIQNRIDQLKKEES